MKKTILILAFFALGFSFLTVEAQTNTVYTIPYSQGFENGLGDWTTIDYNNDGLTWSTSAFGSSSTPAHNGSLFAGSSSFVPTTYGGPGDLAPDDFLVSPRIAVTGVANLSWYYRVGNSLYCADHYSVYVSTTGSTAADFLATTPVVSITPIANDYGVWMQVIVDLSAYIGDTVNIAFRHHDCFGQFSIFIDDVTIEPFSSPWTVTDTMPWSTSFDTPDSGWTFIGRKNGWYIGPQGGLNGSGMYVSGDGGATRCYQKEIWGSYFHWAVRPLHFSESGDYRVDYDWRADGYTYTGQPTTYYDYVRVMLAPVTAELDTSEFFGYGITTYTNNMIPTGWISLSDTNGMHLLANSPNWTHHTQAFNVPAAGDFLLLVLATNGNSSAGIETAPAIDNMSLTQLSCHNSIDSLLLTANSNQGITISWNDTSASQWAVFVGDSLCSITADNSLFLANPALNAASCNSMLAPTIGVSSICSSGDTALPVSIQAVWKYTIDGERTVACTPFALPYSENFDAYQDQDRSIFGWSNFVEIVQYVENSQSHSGTQSLNMRYYNLSSGKKQMVVSPRFDAPGNHLLVSFWAKLPTYSGAATDTVFQAGLLFKHDTMDYDHINEYTIPMLSLVGSDANGTWTRYQFVTNTLADTTEASLTLSLMPNSLSYYECYIDDIEVSYISDSQDSVSPVVSLSGPFSTTVFIDTAIITANLIYGDTAGLTYTWHSSLTGQSYTGGNQWPLVYSVVGIDTISVVATNLYGSDTARHVITVNDNLFAAVRGASTAYMGDIMKYYAVISGLDTVSLSYSWHSTMAAAYQAAMSATGRTMNIVYSANGTDTITLTVTNIHGVHTATLIVNVLSCGVIASFPYFENFEDYGWQDHSACWQIYTPVGLIDNEWRRTYAGAGVGGYYCMYSNGNSTNRAFDAWLITPAIDLPHNSDSITFSFDIRTMYLAHFAVLVSPDGDSYYDGFTDTIFSLSGTGYNLNWDSVSLSLDAYRGRHIRMAFVHYSEIGSLGTVYIDNLNIDAVATLPTDTVWRTVSVTANAFGVAEVYGSGLYADRSMVDIGFFESGTATEGGHWQFLGWDDGGQGNPRRIFLTSDTAIVALFEWVADTVEGIYDIHPSTSHFMMYPNPTCGDVTIKIDSDQQTTMATLTVLDITGREAMPVTPFDSEVRIPKSVLPAGVYIVKVTTKDSYSVKKLIVR